MDELLPTTGSTPRNMFLPSEQLCYSVVLGVVILSLCLSVCCTRALWQSQTMHCGYFDTARKGNQSSSLTPTVVGGRRLFRPKFALKANHPLFFEKHRLRHVSAYNVSTVRDSEKVFKSWRIGSWPRSFQLRAIYIYIFP